MHLQPLHFKNFPKTLDTRCINRVLTSVSVNGLLYCELTSIDQEYIGACWNKSVILAIDTLFQEMVVIVINSFTLCE